MNIQTVEGLTLEDFETIEEKEIPEGRMPSVFIAGFPKCGTTALHKILVQHLDISQSQWLDDSVERRHYVPPKEHYFFSSYGNYDQGLDWYKGHFCKERQHALDSTPTYATERIAIERIAEAAPDAKIIIALREPVARAFSAWNHWNQLTPESRWPMSVPEGSFEDNLQAEVDRIKAGVFTEGFIGHGCYVKHLKVLEEYFDREQIFYFFSVEMRLDFHPLMSRMQSFLEVLPIPFTYKEANRRDYTVSPLSEETRMELRDVFKPYDLELQDFLGKKCPWYI